MRADLVQHIPLTNLWQVFFLSSRVMIFQLQRGKKEPKITYIIMTKTNKLGKHLNNEKITQGEGRTRASTDASFLSMLMPNSFAYGLFS